MIITLFKLLLRWRPVSKTNSAEEDSFDDDIEVDDDFEDIDAKPVVVDNFDARRRLEEMLEDKALQRLINGDFYD